MFMFLYFVFMLAELHRPRNEEQVGSCTYGRAQGARVPPEQFADFIKRDMPKWINTISTIGIIN